MQYAKICNGLMLAGAVMLASCSSEPIQVTKQENFNRDFIKNFGVFNPNHSWNMATRAGVTVTTSSPTEVKIYAKVDGVRYLFGTFDNVNGTQLLNVDVPATVKELTVRANGRAYNVARNASVIIDEAADVPANGTTTTPRQDGLKVCDGSDPKSPVVVEYNTDESTYLTRYGEYIYHYTEILPEGEHNLSAPEVDLNFRFHAQAGKPIVIYPAFWQTSQTNTLGIYFTNAAGDYIEQELFTIKSNDVINKYSTDGRVTAAVDGNKPWDIKKDDLTPHLQYIGVDENAPGLTADQWAKAKTALETYERYQFDSFEYQEGTWNAQWTGVQYCQAGDWYKQNASLDISQLANKTEKEQQEFLHSRLFICKGFVVTFPESVDFGMFMQTSNGHKLYSESWKNKTNVSLTTRYPFEVVDGKRVYKDETVEPYSPAFTATFTRDDLADDKTRRVCFEDWVADNGDFDLNDMVFYVSGVEDRDVIIEEDPWEDNYYEWIIATEDLGDNDFDFNDVVFGVHNVKYDEATDKSTVRVRALAAGGTLPVYLFHNGTLLKPEGSTGDGEFHNAWFSGNHRSNEVINAHSTRAIGKILEFEVDGKFTMSCTKGVENGNMGGFTVRVIHADQHVDIEAPNLGAEIGDAPQMICVPNNWLWPRERVTINVPYVKFTEWIQNEECNDWHTEYTDIAHVWRRNDIPTAPGQGGGGGTTDPDTPDNQTHLTVTKLEPFSSSVTAYYRFEIPANVDFTNAKKVILHFGGMYQGHGEVYKKQVEVGSWDWGEKLHNNQIQVGAPDLTCEDESQIQFLASNKEFFVTYYGTSEKLNPSCTIEVVTE